MKKMTLKIDLNSLPMDAIEKVLGTLKAVHSLCQEFPDHITIDDEVMAERPERARPRSFSPDPYRIPVQQTEKQETEPTASDNLTEGQKLVLTMIQNANRSISKAEILESDASLVPRDVGTWLYSLKSRKLIRESIASDGDKVYEIA